MKLWTITTLLAFFTSAFQVTAADDDAAADGVDVLSFFTGAEAAGSEEPLLGMVGFYGQPQPPQWLILTSITEKPGVLRESVVSGGKVVAERQFRRLPGQDLPDIPIARKSLRISSLDAFKVGEAEAKRRKVSFDSVHFQLRCRDQGSEPVWMLSLIDRAQVSVGAVYLSAITGKVLRTTWREPVTYSSAPDQAPSSNSAGVAARTAER